MLSSNPSREELLSFLKIYDDEEENEFCLYSFVKAAWPSIEGSVKFIPSWHIEAICEHLEAVVRGDIKKLIISVPPRTSKTTTISIMFPAWVWTTQPSVKFLFASYAQKISWEHSRLCRLLIESPWYKKRWGDKVRLCKDQATKGHFVNELHGHRISTSVGAGATALGANFLIMDDPNDAKDGESEVTREGTNDWVSRVWFSRMNPGQVSGQVLVQQRVHEMDVSGYLMSRDENNEWIKLILPMEFESARRAKTIVLPSTNGKSWQDPRTKEGELLCPDYLDEEAIKRKKIELGTYNYAGQYQQRPAPAEGGILKKEWFKVWKEKNAPKLELIISSWDTAFSDKKTADYSACLTFGVFKDENKNNNLILLSLWRDRVAYPDLIKRALRLNKNYSDTGVAEKEKRYDMQPDIMLVEKKASGQSLIQDLNSKGLIVSGFDPSRYGDKLTRVHLISSYIQCGRVWVAAQPPEYVRLRKDSELLLDIAALFPNGDSRDVVDCLSQALLYLTKERPMIKHTQGYEFKQESKAEHLPGYKTMEQKAIENFRNTRGFSE